MEAIGKSGKILHGKIAEILVRKGSATPYEGTEGVKKVAPKQKKAPKKAKK